MVFAPSKVKFTVMNSHGYARDGIRNNNKNFFRSSNINDS